MLIDGKFRCAGCTGEIEDEFGICSCGYNNDTDANPPHCLQVGTVLNDTYVIGRVIGEGGFGITYVGWDKDLDKKVAIKEFYMAGYTSRNTTVSLEVSSFIGDATEVFEKNKDKFIYEAKKLASFMEEKGIVTVYRFFRENNTAYIVMEYVEGVTLKQYLKQKGKLTIEETMGFIGPVMNSLARVHEKNLVHRDISPDNIMITAEGSGKLIDFGAAREVNGGDKSLSVVLKHGFAPMEQYQTRGNQGPWTDVYALSATIYNCITGNIPDMATDRVMNDSLKDVTILENECSREVADVLRKGLSISIDERYHTVGEFKAALMGALNAKPAGDSAVIIDDVYTPQSKAEEKSKKTIVLLIASMISIIIAIIVCVFALVSINRLNSSDTGGKDAVAEAIASADGDDAGDGTTQNGLGDPVFQFESSVSEDTEEYVEIAVGGEDDNANSSGGIESVEVGDIVIFGKYEQDNNYDNGKENIEWIVIDKAGDDLMLVSKYALACVRFNTIYENTPWDSSTVRNWLNGEFYNDAFSADEKQAVQFSDIVAGVNPKYGTYPGMDTQDRVFLLSIDEVNRYLRTDELRKCAPTAYAIAQGAYLGSARTSEGKATCWWWLRSPGDGFKDASNINGNGEIRYAGYSTSPNDGCVRPAIWVSWEE